MKKPDKIEKIIITGLILLVTTTLLSRAVENRNFIIHKSVPIYMTTADVVELPKNIRELSKKYKTYEDLYKSDKLTLVYNYTTYENPLGRDENFHKTISEKLKNENIDIETVVFKNWQDDTFEISLRNKQYIDERETCGPSGKEESQLENFVNKSQHCINNACLVDVKNHKLTIMSAEPDFIIKTIKTYNSAGK